MFEKVKTFGRNLGYVFHVDLHPFDGFWDLKHEKKGKVSIAVFLILMYVLTDIFYKQFGGYTFNSFAVFPEDINVLGSLVTTALVVLIWVLSNWGFTTLFDGEGSMKDILIYTGYSLMPIVLSQLILLPLSNVLSTNEATIISLIQFIGIGWTALLIYTGTMTTHQYGGGKTFLTLVCVALGMVIIVFLGMMFFFLIQEMFNFVYSIYRELELRR